MFSDEELDKIEKERNKWEENILDKFIQKGERKEVFETPSSIPLNSI